MELLEIVVKIFAQALSQHSKSSSGVRGSSRSANCPRDTGGDEGQRCRLERALAGGIRALGVRAGAEDEDAVVENPLCAGHCSAAWGWGKKRCLLPAQYEEGTGKGLSLCGCLPALVLEWCCWDAAPRFLPSHTHIFNEEEEENTENFPFCCDF